jgi:hypothetical protein
MMTTKILFGTMGLLFLCSCMTVYHSPEELMKNPKTIKKTEVFAVNYQKAFRNLSAMTRKCLQRSTVGNSLKTEENLDLDKQFGEIRYVNVNAFWGADYFGYFILRPVEKDQTELTSYHQNAALGSMDNSASLKAWILGSESCHE